MFVNKISESHSDCYDLTKLTFFTDILNLSVWRLFSAYDARVSGWANVPRLIRHFSVIYRPGRGSSRGSLCVGPRVSSHFRRRFFFHVSGG